MLIFLFFFAFLQRIENRKYFHEIDRVSKNKKRTVNKMLKIPIESHKIPCYTKYYGITVKESENAENLSVYGYDFQ